ncbi:hypothetical protein Q7P37_000452 [Cladosporium fusiforme]
MKTSQALLWTSLVALSSSTEEHAKKPNFLFILTDDQDLHMQSIDYMPLLNKHITSKGTTFEKHYCTVSICCPSRVNIWTGLAAHNNNVTDLSPPYGGYPKFVREGLNDNWLPVWLQQLGYNTYYTGKLFNSHTVDNYDDPPVNGFNGSDFLLDPFTYEYWNATMTHNGELPVSFEGKYSPDVMSSQALGFLDDAASHKDPFFIAVAPIAPHSNMRLQKPRQFDLPQYAERHADLFKDYKIPRTENFNPEIPSGVSWVRELPKLNQTLIDYHDEFQRSRLRALQSVDEMIDGLVQSLESKGLLDNTYIIYTTDNGFHISQHRLPPGKECPFEEDIHIPLIIRGPGIQAGGKAGIVSSHTDLTPTILKLAGKDRPDLDGSPIPLSKDSLSSTETGEHVNVEFWGSATIEGKYGSPFKDPAAASNNTYKALRLVGDNYNLLYTVWCTGEREFYDVSRDPSQMHNYFDPAHVMTQVHYELLGRPFKHVMNRLDSLLMVTKSCKAHQCRRPWQTLHPDGDVDKLTGALDKRFDAFYEAQPRVSFAFCVKGHVVSAEGPQNVNPWSSGGLDGQNGDREYAGVADGAQGPLLPGTARRPSFERSGRWSDWV